jgi:cyclopropane-fatty-acyl-phospholipid synthase
MIENLVKNLSKFVEGGLSVELYDSRVIGEGKCKVVVKDPKVIRDIVKDPEIGFGEHYMKGNIQIIGDLEKFLRGCMKYFKDEGEKLRFMPRRSLLKILGLLKFVEKKQVQRHYDLRNDFYSLWLDSSMTYSCAFFKSPDCTLEEAQEEKRRIIYEKLQLSEGDRLLDIGCGWGSIILESAKLYPITAVGIILSKNQYEYVKERIKQEGLEGRVEVYLMHYEDLPKLGLKFNKVVSVGMFEHVGKGRHRKFFEVVSKIMEEGGTVFATHHRKGPSFFAEQVDKKIHIPRWLPSFHRGSIKGNKALRL